MQWRSIDERPVRRPAPRLIPSRAPAPTGDRTLQWMETSVIWLASLLSHAVLGFFLVMFYLEARREVEPTFAVTIWRDAKGKDVLKIGAPEEGPSVKGEDKAPEPPKPEEKPKVEPPKAPPPAPEPAPVAAPPPPPAPEPVVQAPEPVAPPPVAAPEGGVKDPLPPAPALGAGASAGVPPSDTPGLGKPSGPEVTDAEIERDPTAAIRRRRSGTLVALREGSQRDIVVVTGAYDHIQEVLDRLEIPYSLLDPEDLPHADLSKCKALLINCHSNYAAGLFRLADTGLEKEIDALEEKEIALRKRLAETKDKRKVYEYGLELLKVTSQLSALRTQLAAVSGATEMVENVRKFVTDGGYVFTSDWGLTILERAFPNTVKNGGNIGPRTVSLRPRFNGKSLLLEEVFGPAVKTGTIPSKKLLWEIDSGSYAIKIEKPSVVETLVETGDVTRNPAVAVLITPEKASGKALHILSHFQRQATKQGDYALQNLLLNFLVERSRK